MASTMRNDRDFSALLSSKGSSRKMPESVRNKMESSFRTDFSTVELSENASLADQGVEAATSGRHISFASGKMDFSSSSGLALLGHELSHVVSQSKGEVSGNGVVQDHGLESKADAEGARAASMSESSVMPESITPMGGGISASAPIQCKKGLGHRNLTSTDDLKIRARGMKEAESMQEDLENMPSKEVMEQMMKEHPDEDETYGSNQYDPAEFNRKLNRMNDGESNNRFKNDDFEEYRDKRYKWWNRVSDSRKAVKARRFGVDQANLDNATTNTFEAPQEYALGSKLGYGDPSRKEKMRMGDGWTGFKRNMRIMGARVNQPFRWMGGHMTDLIGKMYIH